MKFDNSQMLGLLAVTLPLLILFLWWEWRKRLALIAQFVRSRLLAQLTVGVSKTRQKLRLGLLVGAVVAIFLALARPQWGSAWEEIKQRGLDIVVALDTSRSMLAPDVAPNRLTRAKLAIFDLLRLSKTDRLGLVVFAGTAFLQCPLTLDDDAFRQSVETVNVGIIPQGGTALAEAIQTGLTAFKSEDQNYRIMVLFTDGEDHAPGAVAAAEKAAAAGVRLFTIGIGTPEGELLPLADPNSADRFVKDPEGNVVKSRLNETLLKQIATAGHGFYLPLRGAKPMDTLYEKGLAPLLPQFKSAASSDSSLRLIQRPHERFQWLVALAMLLLLLEIFLPDRKSVHRPASPLQPVLQKSMIPLLLAALSAEAATSPARALKQYDQGQFEAAQREYERLLLRKPEDAQLHYNAGAAAYQAKEFAEATNHFIRALTATAPELALQQNAYYNLGNSLYRIGEGISDPSRKIPAWEQALQSYESALKLNGKDEDTRFNLEFLRLKLEELKQKQPPSPSSDKDKSKDQKESPSSPSSPPDGSPESSKNQAPANPQTGGDKRNENQQNQKPPSDQKNPPSAADQEKEPASGGAQERAANKPDSAAKPNAATEAVPGQMTPQQARQLLDAQKGDEKALLLGPEQKGSSGNGIFKDW